MQKYESKLLRTKLDPLPREHRAIFAATCAKRRQLSYVAYACAVNADVDAFRGPWTQLWEDLAGEPLSESEHQP